MTICLVHLMHLQLSPAARLNPRVVLNVRGLLVLTLKLEMQLLVVPAKPQSLIQIPLPVEHKQMQQPKRRHKSLM